MTIKELIEKTKELGTNKEGTNFLVEQLKKIEKIIENSKKENK